MPHTDFADILSSLAIALACGLLVGFEREQSAAARNDQRRFGGVRTFALVSLLGGICAILVPRVGPVVPYMLTAAATLTLIGVLAFDYARGNRGGITTEVAALIMHAVGWLACTPATEAHPRERWLLAAGISVTTMTLLSMRAPLHDLAKRLESTDIYAMAQLGVMFVIVLPLLPSEGLGPNGVIVPFEVGLLVALIAGIEFVGYGAVSLLGTERSMTATGAIGGLVSSTAVTLTFAGRVREDKAIVAPAALGIALASVIMIPRMLAEVAVVNKALLGAVATPLVLMSLTGFVLGLVLYRIHRDAPQAPAAVGIKNPFRLSKAMAFGAVYVVVLLVSTLAQQHYGDAGLYLSAALAGLTDVDAITLTVARMAKDGLAPDAARMALVIAAGSNTLVKLSLAWIIGGTGLGWRVGGLFVPMLAVGLLASFLQGG